MKLVIDNENIAELPVANLNNIADMARKFADAVEAGEFSQLISATLVLEDGPDVVSFHWGDCPTRFEAIGLLEAAKQLILSDLIDD
jgi:hypothetical protein